MRKRLTLILACMLTLSLLLSACGGGKWKPSKASGTVASCAEKAAASLTDYLNAAISQDDVIDQLSSLAEQLEDMGADDYNSDTPEAVIYDTISYYSSPYSFSGTSENELRDAVSKLQYQCGKKVSGAVGQPAQSNYDGDDSGIFEASPFPSLPYTFGWSSSSDSIFIVGFTFDLMYRTSPRQVLEQVPDMISSISDFAPSGNTIILDINFTSYGQEVCNANFRIKPDTTDMAVYTVDSEDAVSIYNSMDNLPDLIKTVTGYIG